MISTEELERRLERVREHRDEEPAFFRSLLEATVYAHAPVSDDHPRLRLIQFQHPDGFSAMPFFTSEAKAVLAAGSAARVVECRGRELLELTRGATLMLNPNDGGCVLYPEEVESLLTSGSVARVDVAQIPEERSLWVGAPEDPPSWLIPTLTRVFASLPMVGVAYLIEARAPERLAQVSLLVAIGVVPEHAERAARASLTALQGLQTMPPPFALDLITFAPDEGVPDYVKDSGVAPFYVRPPHGVSCA